MTTRRCRRRRSSRLNRRGHRRVALTIANFHLDAGGDNAHRAAQMLGLSHMLASDARRDSGGLIACGDTNAFGFDAAEAEAALRGMLASAAAHGARTHAGSTEATHFFARAEGKIGHDRHAVGKLGIDFPRQYDVVLSAFRTCAVGR